MALGLSRDEDTDTEEQLRGRQNDEFKALKECFTDQLVDLRKLVKVSRNPKRRKRDRLWIPLELSVKIESRPEPIAEFDLHIKCTRKYPLVPPAIGFKNVKGIGKALISRLHKQLKLEAANEEHKGQGCIALLIMRAQQFLEDHYRDLELNNKSFYEQMLEQKHSCDRNAELNRKQKDERDRLERERQVEEIRQKILRKRELYNESRRRRDSQNSNLEHDPDESTYDFEGDLDADSTTASLTDDGDTNRIDEIDELMDDEETLVTKSRRSTFAGNRSSDEAVSQDKGYAQSRVDLEYEVIEELGHGGFGTVYKVRNRVDSRLYALKKVKLNPDNETLNEKIMREVKLLSRLNHENVIRYYTAWNEIETKEYRSSNNPSTITDESAISSKINQESCILSQRTMSGSSDDETDDVYHTSYLINDKNIERIDAGETTANYVVFETSDNKDENEIVESMRKALGSGLSDGESSEEESKDVSSVVGAPRIKTNRWLYIQMELGQGTLREAIDQGLPKQKDRARRFFREILDGLCHIHRQGIIHRDLKPVNIFLDSMDRPKIGDFGLATTNLFIVTQSGGPGVLTATAIKPNRMSLEKLRLLASPDQGDSPGDGPNRSGERLKYIHHNQTDNIGTPLYMSPELSATNERTRISKVIYSHKVDVYSLGIIYFEMLYPFKTGHERISILQDLRKKEISMPQDVEDHLSREDIELIRLLLTHDVAARPTSEKLSTSNLLPSVGSKEREHQNIIKQVVQNRQARTHKHMLRLLFEQNDSYVDDFVFDYEDVELHNNTSTNFKSDNHGLLKDFNTTTYVLDQVKMKLELLLRSKGFINFVAPILMPKYSASSHYNKQQLEDVVMLMDKNSSILTLPYDLRLPFARTIARTDINYMNRFAIERIFRQRQILGYHPDQLWECCVDIITPPPSSSGSQSQLADAEILTLIGEVVRVLPVLTNLKPIIKINNIRLVETLMKMLGIDETKINDLLNFISESMSVSLKKGSQFMSPSGHSQSSNLILSTSFQNSSAIPMHVREDLKRDLLASKIITNVNLINTLIYFLDIVGETAVDLYRQIEQAYNARCLRATEQLKEIRRILRNIEETVCYAQGLGLDMPVRISPSFVLGAIRSIHFYSGMICLLECKRSSKVKSKIQSTKTVILAVGGRYDKLLEKFSRSRSEVFDQIYSGESLNDRDGRESRLKVGVGVSFEVEKISRFVLEDYIDRVNNQDFTGTPAFHQLIQMNSTQIACHNSFQTQNHLSMRYWPIDIAICSLSSAKSRQFTTIMANIVKQIRDKGFKCYEIKPQDAGSHSLESLANHCMENKVPYMITIKSQTTGSQQNETEDSFFENPANVNPSEVSAAGSPGSAALKPPLSPTGSSGYIAILYQLDRGRLKEMKRCDVASMIEFLAKR
jgi:serine/threonine protein kinase